MFLAKTVTLVVAVLAVVVGAILASGRARHVVKGHIEVTHLNDIFQSMEDTLRENLLSPPELKAYHKAQKAREKAEESAQKQRAKQEPAGAGSTEPRLFVVDFHGDVQASAVTGLREEITAILTIAGETDEVLLRLESPGGMVHAYGLAASQLLRLKGKVKLTIAVDKVAASGGYLMACMANRIIAAPFAVIGSIGVVAQIPNFHRLLRKNEIDVEVLTAGEYKRTLTVFGENTEQGRRKFIEELEDVHSLFKDFVTEHRPGVDIVEVATGEAWYGTRALALHLVDELLTSDEYLLSRRSDCKIYKVSYSEDKSRIDKVMEHFTDGATRLIDRVFAELRRDRSLDR